MSHTDYIEKAPENFRVTAHTPGLPGGCHGKRGKEAVRGTVSS